MKIRKKTTLEIVRGLLRKPSIVPEDAEVRLGFYPPCYYRGEPVGHANGCYMTYVSVFPYRKEVRVWVGADAIFGIKEIVYTEETRRETRSWRNETEIHLPLSRFEKHVLAHEVPDTFEIF